MKTAHNLGQGISHTANTSPTQKIAVGDTQFAYREFGERRGIPVIFLHHFTAVLDDWDPRIIDGMAAKKWVITFDNRGIGGSGGRTPTSVSAMADDAIAFIRALGHKQVDLIGFSLGGFITQAILAKEPQLIRRAVLAGTGPAGKGSFSKLPIMVGDMMRGLLTGKHSKQYLFFTTTANGKAAGAAFMARLQERTEDRVRPTAPVSVFAQVRAVLGWGSQAPMDLSAIKNPVLVVNGGDDRMLPTQHSHDLARRLPNASLKIYPDAGHGGIFQNHDAFVSQALAHLD